jgi:hypothetical protein
MINSILTNLFQNYQLYSLDEEEKRHNDVYKVIFKIIWITFFVVFQCAWKIDPRAILDVE